MKAIILDFADGKVTILDLKGEVDEERIVEEYGSLRDCQWMITETMNIEVR